MKIGPSFITADSTVFQNLSISYLEVLRKISNIFYIPGENSATEFLFYSKSSRKKNTHQFDESNVCLQMRVGEV